MKPEPSIYVIESVDDPRVALYASMTEALLRNRLDPDNGIIIVESPKVISVALEQGLTPISLLCESKHIDGDAKDIIARCPQIPVYTGAREVLSKLTGYTLTRGVLCAMKRPSPLSGKEIIGDSNRVAVLDGVCDTTNIGAIFRSAAALGIDGILLSPTTCDPLNRRSIRVSMGSVFKIKWGFVSDYLSELKSVGYKTIAMALRKESIELSTPELRAEEKLAIILGTEGDGLSDSVIDQADYVVRIPMHRNVDSLNVSTAAAIAFYELTK